MSKNKLSFAEAIAYMTANPGKEIRSPKGELVRYQSSRYEFLDGKSWWPLTNLYADDLNSEWTIPEEKLPEVDVVAYMDKDGMVVLYSKNSLDHEDAEKAGNLTKCKIKFNQGEE